jgi:hypothetical protein
VELEQVPGVDDCHTQYISKFDKNRSKDNFLAMADCACQQERQQQRH